MTNESANPLRPAVADQTGVDIDELDAALTTGPQHGRDLARRRRRGSSSPRRGTAEPRQMPVRIGLRAGPGRRHRRAGPGGRPADGPARGPRPG